MDRPPPMIVVSSPEASGKDSVTLLLIFRYTAESLVLTQVFWQHTVSHTVEIVRNKHTNQNLALFVSVR